MADAMVIFRNDDLRACQGQNVYMRLFTRKQTPEVDPELAHTREALLAVVAGFTGRLDALEAQAAQTQAQLAKLPAQVAWAIRYVSDAEEHGPELLTAVASEIAAFRIEHPAAYSAALKGITEAAANA
jgi:hypothetical protein